MRRTVCLKSFNLVSVLHEHSFLLVGHLPRHLLELLGHLLRLLLLQPLALVGHLLLFLRHPLAKEAAPLMQLLFFVDEIPIDKSTV